MRSENRTNAQRSAPRHRKDKPCERIAQSKRRVRKELARGDKTVAWARPAADDAVFRGRPTGRLTTGNGSGSSPGSSANGKPAWPKDESDSLARPAGKPAGPKSSSDEWSIIRPGSRAALSKYGMGEDGEATAITIAMTMRMGGNHGDGNDDTCEIVILVMTTATW